MANADSAYPTVLCVGFDAPQVDTQAGAAASGRQHFEAEQAFVRAALLNSGQCENVWLADHGLIGRFPAVDAGFEAACELQQRWEEQLRGAAPVRLRLLLDRAAEVPSGASAAQHHDAEQASLLQQVPPGQIFATRVIVGQLSDMAEARFQVFGQDASERSGGGGELFLVSCNEATITRLALSTLHQEEITGPRCLCLRWRDHSVLMQPEGPAVTMGRGEQADIRVESDLASRLHAEVSFHETNFVLADRSTNGTFVRIDEDEEVCVHNERIVLRGCGVISLGRRIQGGRGKLIYFNLTSRPDPASG
jgi:hypothetical protein